jgi:hypothetical protein
MLPPEQPEDPFFDQLEWLNNRYNPGYFLGGTLVPELRLSLGRRAKRVAGLLAFTSGAGVTAVCVLMSVAFGAPPDPWSAALGVLNLLVGLKMWRSARSEASKESLDVGDERRQLGRALGMVVLATLLVSSAAVTAVVIVAVAVALSGGATGIAAGLAVLAAIVALRGRRDSRNPRGTHDPERDER